MWSYSARRLKIRFDLLSNRGDSHSKLLGETEARLCSAKRTFGSTRSAAIWSTDI